MCAKTETKREIKKIAHFVGFSTIKYHDVNFQYVFWPEYVLNYPLNFVHSSHTNTQIREHFHFPFAWVADTAIQSVKYVRTVTASFNSTFDAMLNLMHEYMAFAMLMDPVTKSTNQP